jgi:hypothetical protein
MLILSLPINIQTENNILIYIYLGIGSRHCPYVLSIRKACAPAVGPLIS